MCDFRSDGLNVKMMRWWCPLRCVEEKPWMRRQQHGLSDWDEQGEKRVCERRYRVIRAAPNILMSFGCVESTRDKEENIRLKWRVKGIEACFNFGACLRPKERATRIRWKCKHNNLFG